MSQMTKLLVVVGLLVMLSTAAHAYDGYDEDREDCAEGTEERPILPVRLASGEVYCLRWVKQGCCLWRLVISFSRVLIHPSPPPYAGTHAS